VLSSYEGAQLFTCARPGRSKGADRPVDDALVHRWVEGLPGGANVAVVSLLGRKQGSKGVSEFSFYSFYGVLDSPQERGKRPSFQEWLDRWHRDRAIRVVEHPTYDFVSQTEEELSAIESDVLRLLSEGRTVVLMDSGGETRTRRVCNYMGLTEDISRS
jgi:hypothetical protein